MFDKTILQIHPVDFPLLSCSAEVWHDEFSMVLVFLTIITTSFNVRSIQKNWLVDFYMGLYYTLLYRV